MKKVAIIIPYFGKWPEWFELYLTSLSKNPQLDVIFYTDIPTYEIKIDIPSNAIFHKISFNSFCELVSKKLNIDFSPQMPYKLCDLKPFYPTIFQNELNKYDYVGWGDIDLVYGDLDAFLYDKFDKYDVISTHCDRFSGHFCLLKNDNDLIKKVFNIPNWQNILVDHKHHGIDETLLTDIFLPDMNIPRRIFHKMGGYSGFLGGIICWLLGNLVHKYHPNIYMKEMWTTPKPPRGTYIWDGIKLYDNHKKELPYLHFLFFKKTQYLKNNNRYWHNKFYHLTYNDIILNKPVKITADGINVL